MRKHIIRFVAAILTFAIGIVVGSFGENLVMNTHNLKEISEPLPLAPIEAKKVCELHGSVMNKEVVHVDTGYASPEAALFESHLVGGSNTWAFWGEHDKAVRKLFPHGYKYSYRKCELSEDGCKEIEVCPTCRSAEIRWVNKAIREKL
ncbi:MAG TPA: hypothetical protein VF708_05545 [Pyrinomonadaceae bacterium]|jgi:hypothetical protein